MVGDDLQVRKLIEIPSKHQPRHCDAGFVRPAKGPPDFILRSSFRHVIGEIGAASGMQPDRNISASGFLEYRKKFWSIERFASSIRIDLNAERAKFIER